jgi:hypothetical protein
MWKINSVETLPYGKKLNHKPEELFLQWELVFSQADKNKNQSLEYGIKNYKYPKHLGNLTKEIKPKFPFDSNNFYFVDEYNDKNNMFWKLDTTEGIFYFTTKIVVLPSGLILLFD